MKIKEGSQNALMLRLLEERVVHSHELRTQHGIGDPSARFRDLKAAGLDVRSKPAPRRGRNGSLYKLFPQGNPSDLGADISPSADSGGHSSPSSTGRVSKATDAPAESQSPRALGGASAPPFVAGHWATQMDFRDGYLRETDVFVPDQELIGDVGEGVGLYREVEESDADFHPTGLRAA